MANVYEEFFLLKYHGGWSFSEAYNLPVVLRRWFLERLAKQITTENEAKKKASGKKTYDVGNGPDPGRPMIPKR